MPAIAEEQASQRELVERFLVDNPELEELSARLSAFNVINVLRIEKTEIRHSNVLAWLLDPRGSHGLGDVVLRRFLSSILLENPDIAPPLTAAEVELMPTLGCEVIREHHHIDILVVDHDREWVLLIENKIRAGESEGQLSRYLQAVEKEFRGYRRVLVFLTLEGDEPSEEGQEAGYVSWSHAQVHDLLAKIMDLRKGQMPPEARIFVEHYLAVLRRYSMTDQALEELCKRIYQKHREAIDLIVELGSTTPLSEWTSAFLHERGVEPLLSSPNSTYFVPSDWEKHLAGWEPGWRRLKKPYPVFCWFYHRAERERIKFLIEVGPLQPVEKRLELVAALEKEGFRVGSRAHREQAKFTRFFNISQKLKDPDDEEDVMAVLGKIWNDVTPSMQKTGAVLAAVLGKR